MLQPSINWIAIEQHCLGKQTLARRLMVNSIEQAVERSAAFVILQAGDDISHFRSPLPLVIGVWMGMRYEWTDCYVGMHGDVHIQVHPRPVGHAARPAEDDDVLAHLMALGLESIFRKHVLRNLFDPQAEWVQELDTTADAG